MIATTQQVRPRLLVLPTLRESWRFALQHRKAILLAGALPFGISAGVGLLASHLAPASGDLGTNLIVGAVVSAPFTAFEIGWHRLALSGQTMSWRDLLKWSQVHTLFLGWNMVKQAAFQAVSVLERSPMLMIVAYLALLYILARMAFILPAAAIGEPPLPALAWQRSSNNGWRLVLLRLTGWLSLLLATSPVLGPALFLSWSNLKSTHHVHAQLYVPFVLVTSLMIPLGATTVAMAFRALRDFVPDAPEEDGAYLSP